jgi:hypothetical protein
VTKIVCKENVAQQMTELLMQFVDIASMFPSEKPDAYVWERVFIFAPQTKQEQSEPVAHIVVSREGQYHSIDIEWSQRENKLPLGRTALYTTPQQRDSSATHLKPLTDEQIMECAWGLFEDANSVPVRYFARAIEAAHGITASEAEDSARSKT